MKEILGFERYLAMVAKRNKVRDEFVEEENRVSIKYNREIQKKKKKSKNMLYFWIYSVVAVLVLFLFVYKDLDKAVVVSLLSLLLAWSFVLLALFFIRKTDEKQLVKQYEKERLENDSLRLASIESNLNVAKEALSILCWNNHHYELSMLSPEERVVRWRILIREYCDAINKKFKGQATLEDIITYFDRWRQTS